jgi:hypothetical protein
MVCVCRDALTLIHLAFWALGHNSSYLMACEPNAAKYLPSKEKSQTSLEGAGFLNGADYRIRTDDLPLTRRLLYQLS